MTMRVLIQNTDTSRKLRVIKRSLELDANFKPTGNLLPAQLSPVEVEPAGSIEVWLHNGCDCVLEEV